MVQFENDLAKKGLAGTLVVDPEILSLAKQSRVHFIKRPDVQHAFPLAKKHVLIENVHIGRSDDLVKN